MSGAWRPLSDRLSEEAVEEMPHEGVPPHLRPSLEQWIERCASEALAERVAVRLRMELPTGWGWRGLLLRDRDRLLDVVDALLYLHPGHEPYSTNEDHAELEIGVEQLRELLYDAGSAYMVAENQASLIPRIDGVVLEAAKHVQRTATANANHHLWAAWGAVYGLHPDPSKAYSEAIKAVEAASIPVVVPAQAGATLGHVLGQLDRQGHLYELAITDSTGAAAPVPAVTHLVRLLWEGHSDRHGGSSTSRPICHDAAEMAVHLATTLIHWFTAGHVRRKP